MIGTATRTPTTTSAPAVTLRLAPPQDGGALERLAQLDSSRVPREPELVAEVGGQLRATLSLSDGAVVANPFHQATAVVTLLRARAAQLCGQQAESRTPISVLRGLVGVCLRRRLAAGGSPMP
jgi:hypothetical protein